MTEQEERNERERNQREAQEIEAGRRLQEIMDDPAFKEVVIVLEKDYFQEFLSATSDDTRRNAQAKCNALRDVAGEMRARFDRGRTTATLRELRLAEEAATKRRT